MRKKVRIFSNGFDIDVKLTDMKGKTIITIPAGATGYFYESKKKVRRKK